MQAPLTGREEYPKCTRHGDIIDDGCGNTYTYEEALERHGIQTVLVQRGTWVVTEFGLESLGPRYPIAWSRINEIDWVRQLSEKTWVDMKDFIAAYSVAQYMAERGEQPAPAT